MTYFHEMGTRPITRTAIYLDFVSLYFAFDSIQSVWLRINDDLVSFIYHCPHKVLGYEGAEISD